MVIIAIILIYILPHLITSTVPGSIMKTIDVFLWTKIKPNYGITTVTCLHVHTRTPLFIWVYIVCTIGCR